MISECELFGLRIYLFSYILSYSFYSFVPEKIQSLYAWSESKLFNTSKWASTLASASSSVETSDVKEIFFDVDTGGILNVLKNFHKLLTLISPKDSCNNHLWWFDLLDSNKLKEYLMLLRKFKLSPSLKMKQPSSSLEQGNQNADNV